MKAAFSQTLRYLAAALALGVIGYFASEAFFWSFRPDGTGLPEILMTALFYAFAAGTALSAALVAGLGGWRGAFLGGTLMGFGIEGVVVTTMYEAFPFQLVWTPIAWHGLISGLVILGLGLAGARIGLAKQMALLGLAGLFGGVWAFYWPLERSVLPPFGDTLSYLVGSGIPAALGLAALARLLPGLDPPRPVLALLPLGLILLFGLGTVSDPRPERLAWPLLMTATFAAMLRLGRPGSALLTPSLAGRWRHGLLLIVPVVTAAMTVLVRGTGGFGVHVPVALFTGVLGLVAWLWLLAQALRRQTV